MPFIQPQHEPRPYEQRHSGLRSELGRLFGLPVQGRVAGSLSSAGTSRLPWLLRLLVCHLLPVCCLLGFGAGPAAALPLGVDLQVDAPMCDPAGASVAAAVDIPEVDRGHFEALPCEAQLLLIGWRLDVSRFGGNRFGHRHFGDDAAQVSDKAPPPPRELQPPRGRYEGTCELCMALPARPEPLLVAPAPFEGLAPSSGHTSIVYRPPVARA